MKSFVLMALLVSLSFGGGYLVARQNLANSNAQEANVEKSVVDTGSGSKLPIIKPYREKKGGRL